MFTEDAFITTTAHKIPEREYFFQLTQKALELNGFRATIVQKPMLERYFECERLAQSDIYILCDDDIIPATHDTLKHLIFLMRRHPELSQLGLGWSQNMQSEFNSSWRRGIISPRIWEFGHCGGCMAIRKGTIRDLGYQCDYSKGRGDDQVVGDIARELGYKVGIAHQLYFHHLANGQKYSTVWK